MSDFSKEWWRQQAREDKKREAKDRPSNRKGFDSVKDRDLFIYAEFDKGTKIKDIADKVGVSLTTIYTIKKAWKKRRNKRAFKKLKV